MLIRNKFGERIDHALHPADNSKNSDKLIILAHGLTGDKDREMMLYLAESLAQLGWSTLRISYSGCGMSEGKFTDATISKESDDLSAILDQVKGTKRIAYIGYSMGAAVGALTLAKDDRINVMVSLAGMVRTKLFAETEFGNLTPDKDCMWEDQTNPLSKQFMNDLCQIDTVVPAVREIRIPWLLIHGSEDDVVLPNDSLHLYNHLKGKKKHTIIENTDHSFEGQWDTISENINEWLKTHF